MFTSIKELKFLEKKIVKIYINLKIKYDFIFKL